LIGLPITILLGYMTSPFSFLLALCVWSCIYVHTVLNVITIATISTSTLLIGYYHGVLTKEINADALVERMATNEMLSTSDQELISIGHSLHQRNLLLLGCVQHMSTQTLLTFCELVQELYPNIGLQLVTGT